jgi:putative peptidoglycan lipid II flippase
VAGTAAAGERFVTAAGRAGRGPVGADPAEDPGEDPGEGPANLLRASRTMAVGTVFSRATGFLRVAVVAAAIGAGSLGDAYNVANVLPNIVYELLLGGVLTSVVVPLLVAAARRDSDGGEAYAARLLTLVALMLGVTSLVAVLAAPLLIGLYGRLGGGERDLAVIFARFFLPQILFYGVGATMGAILNTRDRFAAPMWAPVLNNLVVIGAGLVFFTLPRPAGTELLTTAQTLTLAVGTTTGIVVQTIALLPSLRASGFRWRPRFDFRGTGLGPAGRLAGWVLLYVLVNQLGYLVVVNLATAASRAAGAGAAAGYSPYFYAFTLFSLPHAVVAVSVITALLPRMSRHAVDFRLDELRRELSGGLRLAAVVLVPAAVGYVALGPLVATAVFNHGAIGVADAGRIGTVLAAFAVGLLPFSAFQLQLRAFYALQDTRTPALVNIAVNAVMVAVDLLLYAVLPPQDRVVGLALGYAASYAAGFALTDALLRRRLPARRAEHVLRTHVRLLAAALLAAVPAYGVARLLSRAAGSGAAGSALAVAVALAVGTVVYVLVARRLRVAEVHALAAAVRLRRRRA